MGSGKSSVAALLAEMTGSPFVDLDEVVVKEAGKTIHRIFKEDGEAAFRDWESLCLEKALTSKRTVVIATGGGAVISAYNREIMKNFGVVINLMVSLPQVLKRLQGAQDRPLFSDQNPEEGARRLMMQREPFYAEADIRIDTDGKSVEDVAAEIMSVLTELPE
jgi:shikimate kinase